MRSTRHSIPPLSSRFDLNKHPLLQTFSVSETHLQSLQQRREAGQRMIDAFRRDGIINIQSTVFATRRLSATLMLRSRHSFRCLLRTKWIASTTLHSAVMCTADRKILVARKMLLRFSPLCQTVLRTTHL